MEESIKVHCDASLCFDISNKACELLSTLKSTIENLKEMGIEITISMDEKCFIEKIKDAVRYNDIK